MKYICAGAMGFGLTCIDGIVGLGDAVVVAGCLEACSTVIYGMFRRPSHMKIVRLEL
jgi:hypothetical protein